jgi:hypothetical protein
VVYHLFYYSKTYLDFFSVVVVLVSVFFSILLSAAGLAVSAAGLAGPAAIVSAGAGEAGAVVADDVVEVESFVLVVSVLLLPQEATKRPIESASTLNFTNFIIFSFLVGYAG